MNSVDVISVAKAIGNGNLLAVDYHSELHVKLLSQLGTGPAQATKAGSKANGIKRRSPYGPWVLLTAGKAV